MPHATRASNETYGLKRFWLRSTRSQSSWHSHGGPP
jgi:hypothetical protein